MMRFMVATNINRYKIGFTDRFFFDTNIWILLFGSIANYEKKDQQAYSKFLEELITREKGIYITSMVISEFSNVILRKNFKEWSFFKDNVGKDYKKDYVGTKSYKETVETISIVLKKILKLPNVIKIGDNLNSINFDAVEVNFLMADFNDSYFTQLAIINNYKIVTNDKDFQKLNGNFEIITTQI